MEFTRSRTDSTSSLSSLTTPPSSSNNNANAPPMALEDLSKIQHDLQALRQRRQQVREEQEQAEQEQDAQVEVDDEKEERNQERSRDHRVSLPPSPFQKPRAREKERDQYRLEQDLFHARSVLDGMQADYSVARSITQQYQFWVLSTHSQVAAAKQTLVRALEQQQEQKEQRELKREQLEVLKEDLAQKEEAVATTARDLDHHRCTEAAQAHTTIKTVPCSPPTQDTQQLGPRHSLSYSSSSSVSTASSPRSSLSSVSLAELSEDENQLFSCLTCYHEHQQQQLEPPTTVLHQEHSRVKVKIEDTTVEDDAQISEPHSHLRPHLHAHPQESSLISQNRHQQQQQKQKQQQEQQEQQQQGEDEVGELWIKHLEREHSDLGTQLSLLLQEKAEAEEIKKEWADRLLRTKNRIKGFESALSELKS